MSFKTELGGTCSLCYNPLDTCAGNVLIDENILELCTFLIPTLDTYVLHGSPVCENCLGKIHEAYNFKALRHETLKLDVKQINDPEFDVTSRNIICIVCRNVLNKYSCAPLMPLIEENDIKDTILYLVSEKEFKSIENPQSCADCQNIVLSLCDILTLLSIYELRSQAFNVDFAEKKFKIPECENLNQLSIKNEFEPMNINYDCAIPPTNNDFEIKREAMEPVPSTSKAVPEAVAGSSSYDVYKCKNEEVDLKMEQDEPPSKPPNPYEQEEWNAYETYRVFKHHNSDVFVCLICRYSTGHQLWMHNHSLMHKVSEDVNFDGRCPCCVYRATRKLCLISHMMSCHQGYSDNKKRKRDYSTDTDGEGSFCNCRTCVYEMKMNPNDLFTDKVLTYKCFQCPYQTKWTYFLAKHMKTHKNECPECEFQTKSKVELNKHIALHKTKDFFFPPFLPEFDKKVETPPKRQRITLHEGTVVKMYSCSVCDFQTIVKPTLKKHMLTHKNSKYP